MLEDSPDQGILYKLGIGAGMPNMCFFDHEGRIIGRGFWRDLASPGGMQKAYAEARWALDIIRKHETERDNKLATANAALLEFFQGRDAPPIQELLELAKVKGVEKKLLEHLELMASRKPIDDVITVYESARTEAAEIAASKRMFALFEKGIVLDTREDKGFVRYWTLAFDGAVALKNKRGAIKVRKQCARCAGEGAVSRMLLARMEAEIKRLGKSGR